MAKRVQIFVEIDVENRINPIVDAMDYVRSSMTEHSEPPEWLSVVSITLVVPPISDLRNFTSARDAHDRTGR